MKKILSFQFKSIYLRFAFIFITVWWVLNSLTFGFVMRILTKTFFNGRRPEISVLPEDFQHMKLMVILIFLVSTFVGTAIILLVVRTIVKPIKELSVASRKVAKGDFTVEVQAKSADEMGRLATDFNKMVQELQSTDSLRKEFVSNVSHEFRTPITSIRGFAKLINEECSPNKQAKEYSEIIINESDRLIQLSSNLLRLSELDSEVIVKEWSTFMMDEQIRQVILTLEPLWSVKNIEFKLELEEIKYTGHEDLLRLCFINLIQNAIKFSHPNGLIYITLQIWNGKISFRIKDHGIGMNKEDQLHAFDRFYKADKSHSGSGNGLGLSIVKKIIEQSNGKIEIKSEKNKGTSFVIELPIAGDF